MRLKTKKYSVETEGTPGPRQRLPLTADAYNKFIYEIVKNAEWLDYVLKKIDNTMEKYNKQQAGKEDERASSRLR